MREACSLAGQGLIALMGCMKPSTSSHRLSTSMRAERRGAAPAAQGTTASASMRFVLAIYKQLFLNKRQAAQGSSLLAVNIALPKHSTKHGRAARGAGAARASGTSAASSTCAQSKSSRSASAVARKAASAGAPASNAPSSARSFLRNSATCARARAQDPWGLGKRGRAKHSKA